jgi:hypothetical protein
MRKKRAVARAVTAFAGEALAQAWLRDELLLVLQGLEA